MEHPLGDNVATTCGQSALCWTLLDALKTGSQYDAK